MGNGPEFLIIPAAGFGTRMRAVSPDVPKEMLPVGQKPSIQYAVYEGLSAGMKKIIIIINRQKEIIRDYFEDIKFRKALFPAAAPEMEEIERNCAISFLYQEKPRGEWDAISLAKDMVGNCSFAIIYPDNIYFPAPGALTILKGAFFKYKSNVTALMGVNEATARGLGNSGRVDLSPAAERLFRIRRFHKKGIGSFIPRYQGELRSCGISISSAHLFECIERVRDSLEEGEELTDVAVRNLMIEDEDFIGCHLPGTLFDIGNPTGYELCISFIKNRCS